MSDDATTQDGSADFPSPPSSEPFALAPRKAASRFAPAGRALRGLLWNAAERRPRALLRILGQLALLLALSVPVRFGLRKLAAGGLRDAGSRAALAWLAGLLILASVWLAARLLDRRPLTDFGLRLDRAWFADFGFGLGLGAFLMSAAFAVEWSLGWVTVTGTFAGAPPGVPFAVALALPLLLFVAVGFYEELLPRGYLLHVLAEGLHTRRLHARGALTLGTLATALAFGLGHAGNPNADAVSTANVAVAGVLLALPYVLTGRLGLSIGLHVSWNFFQGSVYGFAVSGTRLPAAAFLTIEQRGPTTWTGGAFGPEGGLLGLLLMLSGAALILFWVRARDGRVGLCVALLDPPRRTTLERAPDAAGGPGVGS